MKYGKTGKQFKHFPALKSWIGCKKCRLGKQNKYVLGRGKLPCDVLLIGEAPGAGEIALREAFVGPAGKLLQMAVDRARGGCTAAYTNVLACQPTEGGTNRKPLPQEALACSHRVKLSIQLSEAKAVVLLGRAAQQYAGVDASFWVGMGRVKFLPHPSWVLRQGGTKATVWEEYVEALTDFFKKVFPDKWRQKKHVRVSGKRTVISSRRRRFNS